MAPACLDHTHFRVGEKVDRFPQEIGLRNEVGIQDTNKITFSRSKPGLQSAGLEASAIDAVDPLDVETPASQIRHAGGRQLPSVVGGIVENLDLEEFARIIDFADRFQ